MIHNAISQLRRVAERGSGHGEGVELLTRPGGYMLRLEPRRLDAYRFQQLVEAGRSRSPTGRTTRLPNDCERPSRSGAARRLRT